MGPGTGSAGGVQVRGLKARAYEETSRNDDFLCFFDLPDFDTDDSDDEHPREWLHD